MSYLILAIDPGSTSTKIGVFTDTTAVFRKNIEHPLELRLSFPTLVDQLGFRKEAILAELQTRGVRISDLSAVAARGGLLRPVGVGTYKIDSEMLKDSREGRRGVHAANLGPLLAWEIAELAGVQGFVVDPVSVDELIDEARLSGLPELPRNSLGHALNIRETARRAARDLGLRFENANFVVCHLGGGFSICALKRGRIVDINNANDEGPFSPERSGGLPTSDLIRLCFSGKYSESELLERVTGRSGLLGYLGTGDIRRVEERIRAGDRRAELVFNAMAYQVAKEIGAMAAVLCGRIDGIVIAGGVARSELLIEKVSRKCCFLAPIRVYPGEFELEALCEGAYRVLSGMEEAKVYGQSVRERVYERKVSQS